MRGITLRFNSCLPDYALKITPTREEIRDRAVWVVEHWAGTGVQGTCLFLAGVGLVTAAHCVAGATEIDVYHPSKPKNVFNAKILKQDVGRDLAILEHTIPAVEYYELAHSTRTVVIGDLLTAAGCPGFGPGDKLNVRPGAVTSLPVKHGLEMIKLQQKIAQGMSGGPLLDTHDGVTGINHKGGPEEARDFAVHIKMLDDWLAEYILQLFIVATRTADRTSARSTGSRGPVLRRRLGGPAHLGLRRRSDTDAAAEDMIWAGAVE